MINTIVGLVILLLINSTLAWSQALPDAGVIQREIESSRPQTVEPERAPQLPKTPLEDDPEQTHYWVKRFEIQGASLIATQELLSLLQSANNQSLSAKQLQALGQRISDYYREKGWLARVTFPEQNFNDGGIRLVVIESSYVGSELESASSRADSLLVRDLALKGLAVGEALNIQALESGILKANDLPGVETTAVLVPGEHSGATQVKLKVADLPLISGNLNYANQGIRATGSNQYQGNVSLNNPLGRGDQLSVQALGSENMVSVRGQYGWLLNALGTRMTLYGSHLQYQLGGSYAHLQAEGEGRMIGGVFSQPLIRQMDRNLLATVTLENRLNQSAQLGSLTRVRDINTLVLGLNGDTTDHWLNNARTTAGLQVALGHLNLDLASDKTTDSQSVQAQGDFVKFNLNLSRSEYLNDDWQVSLAFNGQWAGKNLDSSQKFSLGGPNGVRAFPVNEGMGDSGWLLSLELQRQLGFGLQGFVFADTGAVEVNRHPWSTAGDGHNRYLLSGLGLGLRWSYQQQWQASATVGLPVTSNPARDLFDHNADGTRVGDPVGWLSLTRVF